MSLWNVRIQYTAEVQVEAKTRAEAVDIADSVCIEAVPDQGETELPTGVRYVLVNYVHLEGVDIV